MNDYRVEVTGEVRVSYPGLGMGISLTEVSDKDRERLRCTAAVDFATLCNRGGNVLQNGHFKCASKCNARHSEPGRRAAGDHKVF